MKFTKLNSAASSMLLLLTVVFCTNSYQCQILNAQEITLIGVGTIPGTQCDASGLDHPLDETCNNNMLGGFSAIDYDPISNTYWGLPDRGPKDGAVDWSCRAERISITIDEQSDSPVTIKLLETVILKEPNGRPFTGLSSGFSPNATAALGVHPTESSESGSNTVFTVTSNSESAQLQAPRLDPEGIRVTDSGSFWVSDEYGPRVIEFDRSGKFVRELDIPDRFRVLNPSGDKTSENETNKFGRQSNRGMEGLAISQSQETLFGLMQSPLIQDSVKVNTPVLSETGATIGTKTRFMGRNCRLLKLDAADSKCSELLYVLEDESNKLNEILNIGSDESFVVIERDGAAGAEAQFKKLMLVSTKGSTDISSIAQLPRDNMPAAVKPVAKKVLIDLLAPQWKLSGASMPEKIEGLTFGPDLPDGRKLLLVMSDNDFIAENPTFVYAFAVPLSALKF